MVLGYILFAILSFVTISIFTSRYTAKYLTRQTASTLQRECRMISDEYAQHYFSSDMTLKDFQSHLAAVSLYLDADIYLINTKGKVLANSDSYVSQDKAEVIPDFNILDFKGNSYSIDRFYQTYKEDMLCVYTTVTQDYKMSAYVIICKPCSDISTLRQDILKGAYLSMLILLFLSLIILLIFLIWIHRPMRQIVKAAAAYADGDFEIQIPVHRQDELGCISDTMNFMAMELSSLEEDQRKFVSNVSHDFRSPLTSIKGYAQAMADGTIPVEMQGKYLDIIIFETERLEKLTQSLLELNKYGSKGTFLDLSDFDLNVLIKRTLLSFEGRSKEKHLTFELILTGEQLFVRADSAKIDQVLHNLIDNAVKFSDTDSRIVIETTTRNEKVFVSVKDFGIGIPKDSQNKIWERFYKTDLSRGKDKKGTGLGLSIVREIIHAHKQNINVISTEGVGTEFIFTLPLSNKEEHLS